MTATPIILTGPHRWGLSACDWSGNGRWVALGDTSGRVSIWDMKIGGKNHNIYPERGPGINADWITGLGFSDEDPFLLAASQKGVINLHRIDSLLDSNKKLQEEISRFNLITALKQSPNRKLTAFIQSNAIYVVNLFDPPYPVDPIGSAKLTAFKIAWHPNNRYLAVEDGLGAVVLWDIQSKTEKVRFEQRGQPNVSSIDISPDGFKVIICYNGATPPTEFELNSGRLIRELDFKKYTANIIRYGPDKSSLVVGTIRGDRALLVTSISGGKIFSVKTADYSGITDIVFDPTGEKFVISAGDRNGYVWNFDALRAGR